MIDIKMDKYHQSAVAKRRLLFLAVECLIVLTTITLCACNSDNVNDLFQPGAIITFVLNNGEKDIVWEYGDPVPSPKKDGYKFVCWCVDEACQTEADISFDSAPTSDCTLYAKWEKLADVEGVIFEDTTFVYDGNKHSIPIELPDGAQAKYDGEYSFSNAGTYVVSVTVTKEGCNDLHLEATLTITKAKIENIVFEDEEIVWDGEAHSIFIKTELPEEIKVSYVGNGVTDVGKHLVVAHFEVGDNYEQIKEASATLTIIAKTHVVTFFDDTVCAQRIVEHGKSVEDLPVPTEKLGYTARWNADLTNVVKDMEVQAIYTLEKYEINYICNDGSIEGEYPNAYDIETDVQLPAAERDYYTFVGWIDKDGNSVESIAKGSTEDVTVYAVWTAIKYKTVFYGDGVDYLNDMTNIENAEFTVESDEFYYAAPMRSGYVFEGWYDNPNFENEPITKRVAGTHTDVYLYAKWRKV